MVGKQKREVEDSDRIEFRSPSPNALAKRVLNLRVGKPERKTFTEEGRKHAYLLVPNYVNNNYRLIGVVAHGIENSVFSPSSARDTFGDGDAILGSVKGILLSETDMPIGSFGGLFYSKEELERLVGQGGARVYYFE